MLPLRDYQRLDLGMIRDRIARGFRRLLYVSPTGSGKSHSAARLIEDALGDGLSVGFIAHRKELIDQCSKKLTEVGLPHGIVMAGVKPDRDHAVQVCSIQTLCRREPPPFGAIFVDEAHHIASDSYGRVVSAYPGLRYLVGLTATPCRLDGRGLGDHFDTMVVGSTVKSLTDVGWLVPTRVYAPTRTSTEGIHSRGGDYVQAELQAAMDKPKLVGDIVEHWLRLAQGRQTVCFASGVEHSRNIVAAFQARGISAAHLDATTPRKERESILADLASGRLTIVSNCGILTEGWDCPSVSCIILARPTKSLGLYLQMVGRALRPYSGKIDCLILDHAGATLRHGFIAEERDWTLDATTKRFQEKDDSPSVRLCLNCYAAYPSADGDCPYCEWSPPVKAHQIKQEAGELVELSPTYNIHKLSKHPMIRQLQQIAAVNQYKPGWVFRQMQRIRRGLKPVLPMERKAA